MPKSALSKRKRLEATIAGAPVDRPAFSLWHHWPGDDQRPADLAAAHLAWQQTYDFDFVKMMPASDYCLRDWGVESTWIGGDEGTRAYQNQVIHQVDDWAQLPVLDPTAGSLGQAREAVELTCAAVGDDVPVIMTIFSPLGQLRHLADRDLLFYLRHHPDAVLAGLEVVTESTVRFVESLRSTRLSGIYYAAQMAEPSHLSRAEYERFGRPFDLRVLEVAGDWWFNLLHIHGLQVYFDLFADYPVQAINWHDREAGPSLAEGAQTVRGAVSGGLDRWTMLRGSPADVRREAAEAMEQTGGRRLILSTGCVIMITTPLSNVRAARASVGG